MKVSVLFNGLLIVMSASLLGAVVPSAMVTRGGHAVRFDLRISAVVVAVDIGDVLDCGAAAGEVAVRVGGYGEKLRGLTGCTQ